jgi:hypothetical protein
VASFTTVAFCALLSSHSRCEMVGCATPERLASRACETSCASRAARSPGKGYVFFRLYAVRLGWLAVAGGRRFGLVSMTASFPTL